MFGALDVAIKDTVFDPDSPGGPPRIYARGLQEENPRYKVWLYLAGEDLPYVRSVTYKLHPTFPQPVRKVLRTPSNPNCKLVIWT